MKPPLLILFDVDGTLIRTDGAGVRALNQGFLDIMGWENALGNFSPAGMTDMAIAHRAARWFRGSELTPEEMQQVFERYLEILPRELAQSSGYRVLPGIQRFLEKYSLRGDILIGLGTGNLEKGAAIKLEHGGISDFFRFGGYGSDALDRTEVLAMGIKRGAALSGLDILLERVVVIGDTPLDVEAGKQLGARTVAVATGPYRVSELKSFQPDLVLAHFDEHEKIDSCLEGWV
jgi:phosphoglycolate phosphatase-like HAD superfamily hydrolase